MAVQSGLNIYARSTHFFPWFDEDADLQRAHRDLPIGKIIVMDGRVERRDRLGGVLHEYSRAA